MITLPQALVKEADYYGVHFFPFPLVSTYYVYLSLSLSLYIYIYVYIYTYSLIADSSDKGTHSVQKKSNIESNRPLL